MATGGWYCHLITFISATILITNVAAKTSERITCPLKEHRCLPLSQCHFHSSESDFIYPCHSGLRLVCCPFGAYDNASISDGNDNDTATLLERRKTALFPVDCGIVSSTDKITGGNKADLGQFPWMALLGYRHNEIPIAQFLCGGSIITENYILTAAHCINVDRTLKLVFVRLGELNLTTPIDCVRYGKAEICADPYVDYAVEKTTKHPNFDTTKLENDIALIKTRSKMKFTEYIRPLCLPFERNLENRNLTGQKFIVSGWGKTDPSHLGNSQTLQFTSVTVWNPTLCGTSVPLTVRPIRDTQLCASGKTIEDACKGDSGGPLINATVDTDGKLRYFQVGLVSFASSVTCGNSELPTVYTRIDKFLNWIVDNVS